MHAPSHALVRLSLLTFATAILAGCAPDAATGPSVLRPAPRLDILIGGEGDDELGGGGECLDDPNAPNPCFPPPPPPPPSFAFGGFLAPVAAEPAMNVATAGQAIPLKFSLGADEGLDIFEAGSPSSRAVDCATGDALSAAVPTQTAGRSGLQYDAAIDTYTYVWRTERSWANSCRQLSLALTDGTVHTATFFFAK